MERKRGTPLDNEKFLITRICRGDLSLIKELQPFVRRMLIEETDSMRNSDTMSSLDRDTIRKIIDINNEARRVERGSKESNLLKFIGKRTNLGTKEIIGSYSNDCRAITNNWERCIRAFNYSQTDKRGKKTVMNCAKECIANGSVWLSKFFKSFMNALPLGTAEFSVMRNGKQVKISSRLSRIHFDFSLDNPYFLVGSSSIRFGKDVEYLTSVMIDNILMVIAHLKMIPKMMINPHFDSLKRLSDEEDREWTKAEILDEKNIIPYKERWNFVADIAGNVSGKFIVNTGEGKTDYYNTRITAQERRQAIIDRIQPNLDNLGLLLRKIIGDDRIQVRLGEFRTPKRVASLEITTEFYDRIFSFLRERGLSREEDYFRNINILRYDGGGVIIDPSGTYTINKSVIIVPKHETIKRKEWELIVENLEEIHKSYIDLAF